MKNKVFLFPAALAVVFMSSIIIIISPIGSKTIIPVDVAQVSQSPSLTEAEVLNLVSELPEVVATNKSYSRKKIKTVLFIDSYPNSVNKYYGVYLGEEQGNHSVLIKRFLVDPSTGKITPMQ